MKSGLHIVLVAIATFVIAACSPSEPTPDAGVSDAGADDAGQNQEPLEWSDCTGEAELNFVSTENLQDLFGDLENGAVDVIGQNGVAGTALRFNFRFSDADQPGIGGDNTLVFSILAGADAAASATVIEDNSNSSLVFSLAAVTEVGDTLGLDKPQLILRSAELTYESDVLADQEPISGTYTIVLEARYYARNATITYEGSFSTLQDFSDGERRRCTDAVDNDDDDDGESVLPSIGLLDVRDSTGVALELDWFTTAIDQNGDFAIVGFGEGETTIQFNVNDAEFGVSEESAAIINFNGCGHLVTAQTVNILPNASGDINIGPTTAEFSWTLDGSGEGVAPQLRRTPAPQPSGFALCLKAKVPSKSVRSTFLRLAPMGPKGLKVAL